MAALAASGAAIGQTVKPYRLHVFRDAGGSPVDVGDVGGLLAPDGQNKIGINSLGIVGGTYEAATDVYHGFVWFPNNLGVSGMAFDLRTLVDIHDAGVSGEISIVNDVCASRALVGYLGDDLGVGEAQAFKLDLTGAAIDAESLHTTSGPFSIAYGTNDGTTATIVGQTSLACDQKYLLRAFQTTWSPSGGAGTMSILPKEADAHSSRANDVGRSSLSFVATGDDSECTSTLDPCSKVPCENDCLLLEVGALRWWTGGSSAEVLDGLESQDSGVVGRANNNSGDVGGWGKMYHDETHETCDIRSAFWNGSSATVHDLWATMPSQQEGAPSWAEGISQRDADGCVTVVGINLYLGRGIIWHGFDDTWCAEDLNEIAFRTDADPTSDPPCETTTYVIRRAFDINRFRHITVLVQGPTHDHLGVLTSAADFNGDLKVDATDRAELYANYCSTCKECQLVHDLNGDGIVNSSDMQLLTGTYWSGSSLATVPAICECSQESAMLPAALLDESSALAIVGFSGWDEFLAWVVDAEPDAADAACDLLAYLLHGDQE